MGVRTADFVFQLVKGVVEAHNTFNNFHTIFTRPRDRGSELGYPGVIFRQWTANGEESDLGLLRRQLVVLEFVKSQADERTPAEMTDNVHAGDRAAWEVIMALRSYDEITLTNPQVAAFADADTANETGVVAKFIIETTLGDDCVDGAFGELPAAPIV